MELKEQIYGYAEKLKSMISTLDQVGLEALGDRLFTAWQKKQRVFFCGNGGSAGNATHLVNDLIFAIGRESKPGIQSESLSANVSTLTCLANDTSYDEVFSLQLKTLAKPGDVLIALSGSGNSKNIIRAVETAKEMGVDTFAILGFNGGKCKELVDHPIHFQIDDMQVAEDMQLVACHLVTQWLMEKVKDSKEVN